MEFHKLVSFAGYSSAKELLNRYNVAQAQGVLFDCVRMQVDAKADFKNILRYAKLARLLHKITRISEGHFIFEFTGPASVLRDTRRYGSNMAKFLPSLLRLRGWRMEATIKFGRRTCPFILSPDDNLRPSWPEKENAFDSEIEKAFMEKWGPERREGWSLAHEVDFFWTDQHVFTPDFLLKHEDGRRVFLEIAGFWSKDYVAQKKATLDRFKHELILLAVPEELMTEYDGVGCPVVSYKGRLLLGSILERVNQFSRP
jgi:predicted nuclease of restriction endonuclease-like RecB superfamily